MSRTRRLWALGLTIAVLGAACTTSATRGDDGSIVESGSLSVFSMAAGDCFDDPSGLGPDGMEIGSVGAVPCAEPHDNEAFAVYQIPGGPDAPYPGDQQIYVSARGGCVDSLRGLRGRLVRRLAARRRPDHADAAELVRGKRSGGRVLPLRSLPLPGAARGLDAGRARVGRRPRLRGLAARFVISRRGGHSRSGAAIGL